MKQMKQIKQTNQTKQIKQMNQKKQINQFIRNTDSGRTEDAAAERYNIFFLQFK